MGVNYKDAQLYAKAVTTLEAACSPLGNQPVNAMSAMCRVSLVDAYMCAGLDRKAARLSGEILASLDELFGKSDLRRALVVNELARAYFLRNGSFQRAEELLREGLAIRETKMPDNWRCFDARSLLGDALLGQERFAEAEEQLMNGYQGLSTNKREIPRRQYHRIEESIERLIRLHEIQQERNSNNRHVERASEWQNVLENFRKETQDMGPQ